MSDFERARRVAIDGALDMLSTPAPLVPRYFDLEVARSSQQVLDCEGLTVERAIEMPWLLVSGEAYEGGATVKMDPFHPATLPFIALRFAAADAVDLRQPETLAHAGDCAADVVRSHGVPREISRVSTKGVNAYHVEPTGVLTLMPVISPGSSFGPCRPLDRVTATYLILGTLAGMPADHPARPAIEQHVNFVSNPRVPSTLLDFSARDVRSALRAEVGP